MIGALHTVVLGCGVAAASAAASPATVVWRGASLAARRNDGTAATAAAVQELLHAADVAMKNSAVRPGLGYAVTDKTVAPPSGDKHDYWSVASYFWPCNVPCNATLFTDCSRWCMAPEILRDRKCVMDAAKDNVTCNHTTGLPWSSHDGYPRSADRTGKYLKGDRFRADGVTLGTSTLALGWWFAPPEQGKAYLQRAVVLLRTFFLDEATAMHPNMNFAQGTPGRHPGNPGGTVDFGRMWMLLDAVRLIESEPATNSPWTQKDRSDFRSWLDKMLKWWLYSSNGVLARLITNNIGNAYDLQAMAMATFLHNASAAAFVVDNDVRGRIDLQINGSGMMPKEDERSNSFGYHIGNMNDFLMLSVLVNESTRLARTSGISVGDVDLLNYVGKQGGSVRTAVDWLAPICQANASNWPFPMTNNSGETLAGALPRCRLVFKFASLLFPADEGGGEGGRFARIAAGSSTAPDDFCSLGLSMVSYTRLVFST